MKFLTFFLQTTGAVGQPAGSGLGMLIPLLAIFAIMWLLMIRPQNKKQKEIEKFRQGLKKGDKIVTIGGIYGTVVEIKDSTLFIEIDKDVKIKVDKSSVVNDFSDTQNK